MVATARDKWEAEVTERREALANQLDGQARVARTLAEKVRTGEASAPAPAEVAPASDQGDQVGACSVEKKTT